MTAKYPQKKTLLGSLKHKIAYVVAAVLNFGLLFIMRYHPAVDARYKLMAVMNADGESSLTRAVWAGSCVQTA